MAALDRAPGVDVLRGANPIALELRANGALIPGDFQMAQAEDAIECLSFVSSVTAAQQAASGISTGRRTHEGITIRKAIDRATPLITKALCLNEQIDATFRFFRASPSGDGTIEQFFTVEIGKARVTAITLVSPDGLSHPGDAPDAPAFEDIRFAYPQITWRYEPDGIEFQDTWTGRL